MRKYKKWDENKGLRVYARNDRNSNPPSPNRVSVIPNAVETDNYPSLHYPSLHYSRSRRQRRAGEIQRTQKTQILTK